MGSATYAETIEAHYAREWAAPSSRLRLPAGSPHELADDFCVLEIPREDGEVAYATRCMSSPDDDERLELHMLAATSAAAADSVVEILTAVAHYHRTGRRLELGHTVGFGRPWLPGSRCTHGLISLPYLDGPDLEWLVEPEVRFLWLVPVTEAEVLFERAHGLEALETKFEQTQFDYLDPARPSVV